MLAPSGSLNRGSMLRRITADMLIGLLDAAVESLAQRPLLPEEDDWAQQELLPPILPVRSLRDRLPWPWPVQDQRRRPDRQWDRAPSDVLKGVTLCPAPVLPTVCTASPREIHASVRQSHHVRGVHWTCMSMTRLLT